jgi:O-antigen/teichoic acid export membrane protein
MLVALAGGYRWRRPDWRAARALVSDSRQLLVMQLAHIGQFRAGTIVLAAFGSAVAVAEYTVASRLAEGLVIVAGAVTASSLPLMGAAHAQDVHAGVSRLFARSYRTSILLVGPLIAGLVVTTPIWIALVPRYPDAGSSMAIIGLAVIIFFASSQTTALLNATAQDHAASRSAVAGLTVSVLASLPLARFGAVGVAWARVAGELVRQVAEVSAARDLRIARWAFVRPWLEIVPLLGGIGLALLTRWQPPWIWVAAVLIGIAGAALFYSIGSAQSGAGPAQRTPPMPTPSTRRSSD